MTARFDLYRPIHKAIRRYMNDTLERIGAMDIADDAALNAALDQLDALLAGLRHHLKLENDFVHTAIEARQPAGARRTADDHIEHLDTIAALAAEIATLRAAPADQRDTLAARLYRHLALFLAENLQHMHVEETANNLVLWSLYTDDELVEIHERLVATIPPAEMMQWLRWMALSLAPHELTAMLAGMQAKAPAAVFGDVMALMRGTLGAERWRAVECGLTAA